jgi:hypothetical protein
VPTEFYRHVPDLSWSKWSDVARPLFDRLRVPATTDAVVAWSLGPSFRADGQRMGAARRKSFVRNMLAWLSLRGAIDYSGGKWRRNAERSW